jgi:hypothetical protein
MYVGVQVLAQQAPGQPACCKHNGTACPVDSSGVAPPERTLPPSLQQAWPPATASHVNNRSATDTRNRVHPLIAPSAPCSVAQLHEQQAQYKQQPQAISAAPVTLDSMRATAVAATNALRGSLSSLATSAASLAADVHRTLPPLLNGAGAHKATHPPDMRPKLSPDLGSAAAAIAAVSGGLGNGPTQDNRLAMQAVVDALSVCSSQPVQPPVGSLTVQLLLHQSLALGWMMSREGAGKGSTKLCPNGGILADDQVRQQLPTHASDCVKPQGRQVNRDSFAAMVAMVMCGKW